MFSIDYKILPLILLLFYCTMYDGMSDKTIEENYLAIEIIEMFSLIYSEKKYFIVIFALN